MRAPLALEVEGLADNVHRALLDSIDRASISTSSRPTVVAGARPLRNGKPLERATLTDVPIALQKSKSQGKESL
jgi:hypothetical protein